MTNSARMCLGKLPARHDIRTLLLANYITPEALPAAPLSVDYAKGINSWPMFLNDSIGDCTIAGAGHLIQEWTADANAEVLLDDDQILAAYSAVSGYDSKTGANDNGAYELDVLNYWRKTGIGGHQIDGFVSVSPKNTDQIKIAMFLFGSAYLGLALPITCQTQDVWDVPASMDGDGAPGSWGGHAVPVVAFDADGLTCITWGQKKRMTWAFFAAYCDEAYGCLSKDWISKATEKAPNALVYDVLAADLAQIK